MVETNLNDNQISIEEVSKVSLAVRGKTLEKRPKVMEAFRKLFDYSKSAPNLKQGPAILVKNSLENLQILQNYDDWFEKNFGLQDARLAARRAATLAKKSTAKAAIKPKSPKLPPTLDSPEKSKITAKTDGASVVNNSPHSSPQNQEIDAEICAPTTCPSDDIPSHVNEAKQVEEELADDSQSESSHLITDSTQEDGQTRSNDENNAPQQEQEQEQSNEAHHGESISTNDDDVKSSNQNSLQHDDESKADPSDMIENTEDDSVEKESEPVIEIIEIKKTPLQIQQNHINHIRAMSTPHKTNSIESLKTPTSPVKLKKTSTVFAASPVVSTKLLENVRRKRSASNSEYRALTDEVENDSARDMLLTNSDSESASETDEDSGLSSVSSYISSSEDESHKPPINTLSKMKQFVDNHLNEAKEKYQKQTNRHKDNSDIRVKSKYREELASMSGNRHNMKNLDKSLKNDKLDNHKINDEITHRPKIHDRTRQIVKSPVGSENEYPKRDEVDAHRAKDYNKTLKNGSQLPSKSNKLDYSDRSNKQSSQHLSQATRASSQSKSSRRKELTPVPNTPPSELTDSEAETEYTEYEDSASAYSDDDDQSPNYSESDSSIDERIQKSIRRRSKDINEREVKREINNDEIEIDTDEEDIVTICRRLRWMNKQYSQKLNDMRKQIKNLENRQAFVDVKLQDYQ